MVCIKFELTRLSKVNAKNRGKFGRGAFFFGGRSLFPEENSPEGSYIRASIHYVAVHQAKGVAYHC
jgi:hypothetical protein